MALITLVAAAALSSYDRLSGEAQQVSHDASRKTWYAVPEDDLYKSPIQMAVTKDGARLFVSCENSGEVLAVDTSRRSVVGTAKVGKHPFGLALSPDGSRLYVGNRWDDDISVVDTSRMEVTGTIAAGADPHGLAVDPTGKWLYIANTATDDVSVVDTTENKVIKRLEAGHMPFGIVLSPDSGYLYVSNQLSVPVPFRTPPVLELTVIDANTRTVAGRRRLFSTVIGQNLAVSPDNRFVVVALELPKNLLPETQVYQGWMVTHGFAIVETGPKGRAAYLLLDDANLYFADPFGVAFSPDGARLYISSSGVNVVSVLDFRKITEILHATDGKIKLSDEDIGLCARDLGLSSEYVLGRIATQNNPKQVIVSPDGRWLYIANRLSDSIQVVDTSTNRVDGVVDLGGPKIETELRRGARVFNYSSISFQKQLSCNTCHPENHLDGLVYDIVAPEEGIGRSLVDNRTMRGIAETGPFKWTGKNPSIARQDGPRAAQLFFRSHGFQPDDLMASVHFIESIPLRKSRYATADGRLNEFQKRGKLMYERAYTKDGRYIPVANRCLTCHARPYYTDRQIHDVGTQAASDDGGEFDTPQLGDTYETAPFLHDGRANTLEEIWTVFNPGDTHGATNDMAKENLNDLIEYIKTLSVGEPLPDNELFAELFARSAAGSYRLKVEGLDKTVTPPAQYVGNEVCGTCHTREYKLWLGTKHARTWVMLGMMDKAMKVGSQLPMRASAPQFSAVCLACHGTAADVPPEYLEKTFHIEDGVQCERCHGPGSRYANQEIMKDRKTAVSLGLRLPDRSLCMECHKAKPSHSFMEKKTFDFAASYKRIVHMHGQTGTAQQGVSKR